jgi:hypothetical protein
MLFYLSDTEAIPSLRHQQLLRETEALVMTYRARPRRDGDGAWHPALRSLRALTSRRVASVPPLRQPCGEATECIQPCS